MSKFPVQWKTTDIQIAVKELGYSTVKWIDDESCLIIVRGDEEKIKLATALSNKTIKKSDTFLFERFSVTVEDGEIEDSEDIRVKVEIGEGEIKQEPSHKESGRKVAKRARSDSMDADAEREQPLRRKGKGNCVVM